ncbi:MAG: M23 family metallopeptidase [Actinomycetota bacterium]
MVATMVCIVVPIGAASSPSAAACWAPPVVGVVVDPFRAPPCPYCAGNRGIEYEVAPGTRPIAVAPGTVSFSGVVAGTRYVVVALADGRLVTYGRLVASHLRVGDRVRTGAAVGMASGPFYFGVRRDGVPVDPTPLLGRWGGVTRLVPTDGSAANPTTAVLRCASDLRQRLPHGPVTRPIV